MPPLQDHQEEERPHLPAAGGGSETEEGSLESSLQALLRSEDRPPASEPPSLRPRLPPRHDLPAELLPGQTEEDAGSRVPRVPDAAEGRVEEVLRAQNGLPAERERAVRTPAGQHEPDGRQRGAEQGGAPR